MRGLPAPAAGPLIVQDRYGARSSSPCPSPPTGCRRAASRWASRNTSSSSSPGSYFDLPWPRGTGLDEGLSDEERAVIDYRFICPSVTHTGIRASQNYTICRRTIELPSGRQKQAGP